MIGALRLMLNHPNPSSFRLSRLLLPVFVVSLLFLNAGCGLFGAKRKIEVPPVLTPLEAASKDQLVQEINRLSTVKSIHGKVDIQFEDTSFASAGIADQYRLVDGTITLQRPGQIYLQIQFTFVDIREDDVAARGGHLEHGPAAPRRGGVADFDDAVQVALEVLAHADHRGADLVALALHLDQVADEDVVGLLEQLLRASRTQAAARGRRLSRTCGGHGRDGEESCRDGVSKEHYDPDIGTRSKGLERM